MVQPSFQIVVTWNDEEQVFIASFPRLPKVVGKGKTQDAALMAAGEALELFMQACEKSA